MTASKGPEALAQTGALLDGIDRGRLDAVGAMRSVGRIARLVDNQEAVSWCLWELNGYPVVNGHIDSPARGWAYMAGRVHAEKEADPDWPRWKEGESHRVNPVSLSRLQLLIETTESLSPLADLELPQIRNLFSAKRILVDVVTAVHLWASGVDHRLRFGSAVQTAFEVVRREVDRSIDALVPNAAEKLSAAFENAASDKAEHWANATSTCRRLLKLAADTLRPPGPDVDGRKMDDEHYINRLMDWIASQSDSETSANLIGAEVEYLDARLHAINKAGHKGAHSEVGRTDASRFLVGTYLVLGDILRLCDLPPDRR